MSEAEGLPRITMDAALLAGAEGLAEAVGGVRPWPVGSSFGDDGGPEALIVRSVSRVDEAFLAPLGRLHLLATASSGFDHLDVAAIEARGLRWTNTPGANAEAVADWVEIAFERLGVPAGSRVGVVGVGHVGGAVCRRLEPRGYPILRCDPPRAAREPDFPHVPLQALLARVDALTVHVPLDETTRHMIGAAALAGFAGRFLLNAARGGVVDEAAARGWCARRGVMAIDTWEGEPSPDPETLAAARFVTPHVAGHTAEAKAAITERCLRWVARELGRPIPEDAPPVRVAAAEGSPREILSRAHRDLKAGEPFRVVRKRSVRPAL